MVKRGSTTFSATKVAKAGLAASASLTRILELEKEVSRLRHHVSVLSKRNHVLSKETERKREDEGIEVASPVRVQEPEPQVVAEPEVRMSGVIVAEDEGDVWVATVAKPAVAESRVELVDDEPEVALVRLPKGKRRRTDGEEGREAEESKAEVVKDVGEAEVIGETSIPRAPTGMLIVAGVPVGPRGRARGVVNPGFPMFFNPNRRFGRDHENWPVGGGRGRR